MSCELAMVNSVMRRLLIGATVIAWLGGSPAFAQGMPSAAVPGMSGYAPIMRPPAPTGGLALGSLQVYTGTLGQSQAPALGSITVCPVNGVSGAGATWPAISSLASSATASPSPASPPITSPLATFPVTTSPVPTSPVVGATSMTAAVPAASVSPTITPLGGTLPVTTGFGTSNMIGFCNPTMLGAATPPTLPTSSSPTGAAYSDAAIPLAGTETGGGGLSPVVDVPPPVLYAPSVAIPAQ